MKTLPVLKDGLIRRELAKVETLRDAIQLRSEYPSFGKIEVMYGPEAVEQYIFVNLKYITDIVGLQFNEAQLEDGIQSFLMIRWLTVADLKAFLEYCKRKKFYHRDYKEFLDTFHEYINQTLDTAEGDNIHQHQDIKAQEMSFGSQRSSDKNGYKSMAEAMEDYYRQKR